MKKINKYNILKIIFLIASILPLGVFIIINIIMNDVYYYKSTNYILCIIIEMINTIILCILIAKEKISKKILILIICYLIVSLLIPVYSTNKIYRKNTTQFPTSISACVEIVRRNLYGIDITFLFWTLGTSMSF